MKLISALALAGLALGLQGILVGDRRAWLNLIGLLGMSGSLALFHAAVRATRGLVFRLAFDEGQSHGLVETGPYRRLRHPFYASCALYWTALWACAQSASVAALGLALIVIHVAAANAPSREMTGEILRRGSLVKLVEYPAVARNACRWRLQVMAEHTEDQIEAFTEIAAAARQAASRKLTARTTLAA